MITLFRRQDWILNSCIFFLLACGLIMIASISKALFLQQLISSLLGLLLIFIFCQFDWRSLASYRWIIFSVYLAAVALLIVTYFFAPVIRNTRSWLVIGPL